MTILSDRINHLSESQTISMAKLGRALSAQGFDIINLSFGEPDFPTPVHIREATKKALDEGFNFYTPVAGYPDLRQAIAAKLKRENNLEFTADEIVVSTGAKQAIANAVLCLLNPDDEVIIPTPYWVSYSEMIKLAEARPVFIHADIDSNFKITAEQLEEAITPKSKLFMFSSPCNPTGTVYTREELAALAKVFERHPHVYILSDEIYEHINFLHHHESIAQFEAIRDRVVIVNGLSKAFAMTGWRVGYLAAQRQIAQACDKMQGQITSATCSIAQRAALAALTSDLAPTLEMKEAFRKRRDLVGRLLNEIPGLKVNKPDGAFYFFPDISSYFGKSRGATKIGTATDLCMYLLNEAHVAIVTGEAFGSPANVRLSYAASEDKLKEAMKRIKIALEKLR